MMILLQLTIMDSFIKCLWRTGDSSHDGTLPRRSHGHTRSFIKSSGIINSKYNIKIIILNQN